jgi:hypothetical protein
MRPRKSGRAKVKQASTNLYDIVRTLKRTVLLGYPIARARVYVAEWLIRFREVAGAARFPKFVNTKSSKVDVAHGFTDSFA